MAADPKQFKQSLRVIVSLETFGKRIVMLGSVDKGTGGTNAQDFNTRRCDEHYGVKLISGDLN